MVEILIGHIATVDTSEGSLAHKYTSLVSSHRENEQFLEVLSDKETSILERKGPIAKMTDSPLTCLLQRELDRSKDAGRCRSVGHCV